MPTTKESIYYKSRVAHAYDTAYICYTSSLNAHALPYYPNSICIKAFSASEFEVIAKPTKINVFNVHIQSPLNPLAQVFVPREMNYHYANSLLHSNNIPVIKNVDYLIAAFYATFLILAAFLVSEFNFSVVKDIHECSPKDSIRKLKFSNPNKIILGHLNLNSIRLKFECLRDMIGHNIDILLISETKLNDTFPEGQFCITGFHTPFRKDRNDKGGGLLLYVQEYIPCRKIIVNFTQEIEVIVVEINLKNENGCSLAPTVHIRR